MIDLSQIKKKLNPEPDGQDVLRLRTAVVSAVNTNGTVDITLSGVLLTNVPRLANTSMVVGQSVQVTTYRGSFLVLGPVAQSVVAQVSNRLATLVRVTDSSATNAGTGAEISVDTLAGNLVSGKTYKVTWDLGWTNSVAADTFFFRIREDNLAGAQLVIRRLDARLANGGGSTWAGHVEAEYTAGSTGSKTFAFTIARATGTGSAFIQASTAIPTYSYIDYVRG